MSSVQPARPGRVQARRPSRRVDPQGRNPRGIAAMFDELINARPDKRYVRVHKAATHMGIDYYQWLGYEIERYVEGGARFAGKTCQPGEPITFMDTVLMSIDLEAWKELEQFGANGNRGQQWADQIEDYIIDKSAPVPGGKGDSMRGIMPNIPGVRVTKDIKPLREETGHFEEYGEPELE